MQRIAQELELDPLDVIRRNLISSFSLPDSQRNHLLTRAIMSAPSMLH